MHLKSKKSNHRVEYIGQHIYSKKIHIQNFKNDFLRDLKKFLRQRDRKDKTRTGIS